MGIFGWLKPTPKKTDAETRTLKRVLVMEVFGTGAEPTGDEARSVCDMYVRSHSGIDPSQARVRVNIDQMGGDRAARQSFGLLHHRGKNVEWFDYTIGGLSGFGESKKFTLMVVSE